MFRWNPSEVAAHLAELKAAEPWGQPWWAPALSFQLESRKDLTVFYTDRQGKTGPIVVTQDAATVPALQALIIDAAADYLWRQGRVV